MKKEKGSSAAILALTLLNNIESDAIKFVTTDGSVYESIKSLKEENIVSLIFITMLIFFIDNMINVTFRNTMIHY